jgi:mono/diheme cytochrome c family protein
MKKITTVLVLVILVFACSKKTMTTTETKTQGPVLEKADSETETTLVEEKSISNTPIKTDPAHNDMLVAGQRVYIAYCGRCHALNPVEKFSAQRWDGILKSMIPKAKLNTEQSKQVTAYVMANAKK